MKRDKSEPASAEQWGFPPGSKLFGLIVIIPETRDDVSPVRFQLHEPSREAMSSDDRAAAVLDVAYALTGSGTNPDDADCVRGAAELIAKAGELAADWIERHRHDGSSN